eukprot:CAMPEP_0202952012 /NCGR_PEP_ID=MMETSP1395-20130829/35251_1 /ASSEMBLY_ACC=CAM_ASM_000871 /TAXON_ID=5961 /ORGANISM="Blepharisma japonicum, Strain Stock R1072" /LENGTH=98 /DNA_ID=CAMNT_0049660811 /DNA_START=608 /DNA_END=901 /DNA_ORIENTATION=-
MEKELKYEYAVITNPPAPLAKPPSFESNLLYSSEDSLSDSDEEIRGEPLHNLSLDELVSYIEGKPHTSPKASKKKQKSKASTATTSPMREDEINSDSL